MTLPSTKSEKKRHHTEDYHAFRGHTLHPSSASNTSHYRNQRYSVEFSPRHTTLHHGSGTEPRSRNKSHHEDPHYYLSYGQLTTPTPHTMRESYSRPHSRLSAPEPIPIPFQKSLYHKPNHHQPQISNHHSHESPLIFSPSETPPPTNELIQQEDSSGNKRRQGSLKHSMRKSLSGSIDAQLDGALHGSIPWKGRAQVGPYRRPSIESAPPIGWSSQTQFSSSNQRMGGIKAPADIQSLMPQGQEGSHRLVDTSNLVMRSSNSTEIKPELFMNSKNGESFGRGGGLMTKEHQLDGLMIDYREGHGLMTKRSSRSSSARQSQHSSITNSHVPELSASAKHLGDLEPLLPINGLKLPSHHSRELPHIDTLPSNKVCVRGKIKFYLM